MIIEMVFKRGSMIGCAIFVVKSVDIMPPILLDFMLLVSVVLAPLPCLMTMIIGIFHRRLLVFHMALDPLREAERALNPNGIHIFLK